MIQQPYATESIVCDGGSSADLTYLLLRQNSRYGVRIVLRRNGRSEDASAYGLTASHTTALGLLELLRRNTVTPCALDDVLSELQEEIAKKR